MLNSFGPLSHSPNFIEFLNPGLVAMPGITEPFDKIVAPLHEGGACSYTGCTQFVLNLALCFE
jgi:hypothetical protein